MEELYRLVQELAEKVAYLENENRELRYELKKTSLIAKTGSPMCSVEEKQNATLELNKMFEMEKIQEENRAAFK
jgi:hypothetical protein